MKELDHLKSSKTSAKEARRAVTFLNKYKIAFLSIVFMVFALMCFYSLRIICFFLNVVKFVGLLLLRCCKLCGKSEEFDVNERYRLPFIHCESAITESLN